MALTPPRCLATKQFASRSIESLSLGVEIVVIINE